MENRIPFRGSESIDLDKFGTFSVFLGSSPFEGPDIKSVIESAKQQSFIDGFKEGYGKGINLAFKAIEAQLTKQVDSYILLNTKIVDFIKGEIETKFKTVDFKLIEARADFYKFSAGITNIVFLIETDIQNELWLSSLLNGLEKKILAEEKWIANLMFINQKGKELDKGLIESDYPFVRKLDS